MKPTKEPRDKKGKHRHQWKFNPIHYVPKSDKPFAYQCVSCGAAKLTAKSTHKHRYLPMNYDKPTCKCGKRKGVK